MFHNPIGVFSHEENPKGTQKRAAPYSLSLSWLMECSGVSWISLFAITCITMPNLAMQISARVVQASRKRSAGSTQSTCSERTNNTLEYTRNHQDTLDMHSQNWGAPPKDEDHREPKESKAKMAAFQDQTYLKSRRFPKSGRDTEKCYESSRFPHSWSFGWKVIRTRGGVQISNTNGPPGIYIYI